MIVNLNPMKSTAGNATQAAGRVFGRNDVDIGDAKGFTGTYGGECIIDITGCFDSQLYAFKARGNNLLDALLSSVADKW